MSEPIVYLQTDVLGNLPQQYRGHISAFVKRHGCLTSIGVPILPMRAALSNDNKAKPPPNRIDFDRFQDGHAAHTSADGHLLGPDKLCIEARLSVLEQHGDHFLQVCRQFVERFCLRVRTRKTGHVSDQKARFRIPLDYCGKTVLSCGARRTDAMPQRSPGR